MKRAFVIGHPISHSRSPLIHTTWLKAHGIEGSYEAIDVTPAALGAFLERVRAGAFVGGNVTIPHKEAVHRLCDSIDPLARQAGAVNTLVAAGGHLHGINTDVAGFLGSLDHGAPGWSEALPDAIVLGAGGAARAVVIALQQRGIGDVHILNRTRAKAEALAESLGGALRAGGLEDFAGLAARAGLVVNATAVGMQGTRFESLPLERLPPSAIVTDIVYVPLVTGLLADARARGLRTVDGLGMLLHQAAGAFEAWFGVRPEVTDELRAAVEATLGH